MGWFSFSRQCLCCFVIISALSIAQSPAELIDSVVQTIFNKNAKNCTLYKYNYGGAIIFDSMFRATKQFAPNSNNVNTSKTLDYYPRLIQILNEYIYNDTSTPGYMITHGQTIPWSSGSEGALGDDVGLFPITYLDALLYDFLKSGLKNDNIFDFTNGPNATQWQLIFTTADYYLLQFPRYLPDGYGTASRDICGSWKNEPDQNASFLWGDDNFMGTALPARLAQAMHFCNTNISNHCNGVDVSSNITAYVNWVYNQNMGFATHLLYGADASKYNGLYAHGYNYATDDHSCCPWGRANAWVMTAHVEAIKMFRYLNDSSLNSKYNDILEIYKNQMNEVGGLQNVSNGRFHQVINDTSTFLETSCSTAFLYGMIYGRLEGILPTNVYSLSDWDAKINLGWNGVLDIVDLETGIISDACQGTGIGNDVGYYEDRGTAYCDSGSPGDPAFVIYSMVGYQQYLNFMNKV